MSYRMDSIKKETKLNVILKAMRFDEAVYENENNRSHTNSDKSSYQEMATYISMKNLNNFETLFYYISIFILT